MSKLKGELSSYIKLAEENWNDREQGSRWFKLANQRISDLDESFQTHPYIGTDYSDFGYYIRLKALQKSVEFADHFTDWNNIYIHEIELRWKDSSECIKCYEGMYATAGVSINYLDILYDLLRPIHNNWDKSTNMSKDYFEKNNSQNLKIDEMIQSIIDQMRVFIVEVKGLVPTHNNYWVKFYSIAKENENLKDQQLVLDGLRSLEAEDDDFWEDLEKYQRGRYPEIADIAIEKMKEALEIAS